MTRSEILSQAKPILFNTEMVRAILDGRKTSTRRAVKPQPVCYGPNILFEPHSNDFFLSVEKGWLRCRVCGHDPEYSADGADTAHHWKPKYRKGDYLYVRETWGNWNYDDASCNACYFQFRADYADGAKTFDWPEPDEFGEKIIVDLPKWRPSIHMPKEAARIFLRVTDVRVERLQDITEKQAEKEGFCVTVDEAGWGTYARMNFAELWDATIKPADIGKYGWNANPFVWIYEFERVIPE